MNQYEKSNFDKKQILKGNLILRGAGNLKRNYGFEYIGDHFDMFICPETDKCIINLFRNISQPVNNWKAILVNSDYPINTDYSLRQLSDICGEALIKTSCLNTEQYK